MDFTLSQKIAQSAVTDERADNLQLAPEGETTIVLLTEQEKQERRDQRNAAEERAFETDDGQNTAGVRAAFENDTANGATLFEMGGGDDRFGFGDWNGSTIVSKTLQVDMGTGDGDKVLLRNSIEDYTFSVDGNGDVVILNQKSGVEIMFTGAEQFIFQNKGAKDGIAYDFNDTSFSTEQMTAIASGNASNEIAVAEFIADQTMSVLDIDPGADGVYVDLSIEGM